MQLRSKYFIVDADYQYFNLDRINRIDKIVVRKGILNLKTW